jgi:HEAT repeat protein
LPVPTEVAIAGIQGLLSEEELYADCRTALATLAQPMRRNRLLRLIADLSLVQLAPEIEPLLHAQASEERAAAARTLSRLHVEDAKKLIRPLLHDSVYDVRKAAQTALRNLSSHLQGQQRVIPTRLADGVRSWTVGETSGMSSDEDESEWKARLRALMDE